MRLTGSVILLFLSITASAQDASIQLHGLYEPDPVHFSFETPGWFILAGIILLLCLVILFRQIRKYIKNRYRREALRELDYIENSTEMFPQVFVVLKQTAIHAFGRSRVGPLHGKEWLTFLDETGKEVGMTEYHLQIHKAMYAGKEMKQDAQKAILINAKKWVRTHAG